MDDRGVATTVAETTPARPEDERDEGAGRADDHEDHADGVDVDAGHVGRYGPRQDCSNRDQEKTHTDSHTHPFVSAPARLRTSRPVRGCPDGVPGSGSE